MSKIGAFQREIEYITMMYHGQMIKLLQLELIYGITTKEFELNDLKSNDIALFFDLYVPKVLENGYPVGYVDKNILVLK